MFIFAHAKSTWADSPGRWFYDCENDLDGNRLTPIDQKLTARQRLQRHLLRERDYDPTITPFDLTAVMLNFDLANAKFNARKSFMESRGRFRAVNHKHTKTKRAHTHKRIYRILSIYLFMY